MKCFKIMSVILGLGAFVCIVLGLTLRGWSSVEVQEHDTRKGQSKPWTIFTSQSGLFSVRFCTYNNGTEVECDVKATYQYAEENGDRESSDTIMMSVRLPRSLIGLSAGFTVLGLVSLGCFTMLHSSFDSMTFTGSAVSCIGLLGLAGMSALSGVAIGLQSVLLESNTIVKEANVFEELGYRVINHFPWALLVIGVGALCCFIIQLSVVVLLSRIQIFHGKSMGWKQFKSDSSVH